MAHDPVKKAVKREKDRLKKRADEKTELNQYLTHYFNALPSRVKIVEGSELVIEPESQLKNLGRYIFSASNIGWFFGYFGLAIGLTAVINYYWPDIFKYFGYYIPTFTPMHDLISWAVYLIMLLIFGIKYLQGVIEDLSPLNESFHLKVKGKNFMVHAGNPDEPIAAASKMDSEGQPNITADIDETKGRLKIEWRYGPDINNLITGDREFEARRIPGIKQFLDDIDLLGRVTKGMLSFDSVGPPPLNLSDLDTARRFLKDKGVTIEYDRRIGE